ncbi:MAG TPA: hypothetical protein VF230_11445 [Acidimicrobiales bacterium]
MLAVIVGGLVGMVPGNPAQADSAWCYDEWPATVELLPGATPVPLWLRVESRIPTDGTPHITLCYGTAPPGSSKIIGGGASAQAAPFTNGVEVYLNHETDTNGAIEAPASVYTAPSYTVTQSGQRGGFEVSVRIPVGICLEAVCNSLGPFETGVILGTFTISPTGALDLEASCLAKVAGNDVFCVETFGTGPYATNMPGSGSTCVLGVACVGYLATTNAHLANVYVHGIGVIPIYGPLAACIIGSPTCP